MKQETLTVEEFRAIARRQKSAAGTRKNKYHAQKCCGYDSTKEYRRAQKLKLMQRAGLISDLREQVPFLLVPSQINGEGAEEKPVHYKADFVYTDNATGQTVVEDTKGFRTPEYIIKRKLMLYVHGICIKEV